MQGLILQTMLPDEDIEALHEWQQTAHKPLLAKLEAKDAEIERLQAEVKLWTKCAANFQKDMRGV